MRNRKEKMNEKSLSSFVPTLILGCCSDLSIEQNSNVVERSMSIRVSNFHEDLLAHVYVVHH